MVGEKGKGGGRKKEEGQGGHGGGTGEKRGERKWIDIILRIHIQYQYQVRPVRSVPYVTLPGTDVIMPVRAQPTSRGASDAALTTGATPRGDCERFQRRVAEGTGVVLASPPRGSARGSASSIQVRRSAGFRVGGASARGSRSPQGL